ncbi:DgaE family pyridoxal phosphate-dependent ammonia lyase [Clostridium sp. Marseille-P2415]|uniref:DgaE family pyridoxal phosphate-dependent ammonia lyase n=1 Tax=Clostridium sp. Marseille-P2415 TaxID=1805471 RepID=UPI00098852FF|nr:DgaE family pyridoxal phosphate-dependent ammonia lyase [Clostridium sp. Marseille-P2415]
MENIYSKNGLQAVINASGRMTKLGVSTISKGVGETLVEAAGNYVVIDDLYAYAGRKIGSMIGTEDACVTSSASAGIALAVASLICGGNLQKVKHLYDLLPFAPKREVILLKGQNVDFGAPVAEMIQVGGGKIVEAGYANGSALDDIEQAVTEHTLAIFFVKSHHCVQKEMVDAESVIHLANRLGIPCIVDAAAEEDLKIYAAMGADFVCYSGAKAIEGPTSGFVACKTRELADHMRLQYKGIGRTMKVGKECTMGLVKAIEEYLAGGKTSPVTKEELERFAARVGEICGCKTSMIRDEAGREIYRCKIEFIPELYGMDAKAVVKKLQEGAVAIFTRDYQANIGSIAIDPRPLNSVEELDMIYRRLLQIQKSANGGK